ncbi:TetR/AcrR family transcriptional regulator [Nocardioides sp. AE5]|uniref:TetR/AcrR family transcriptional regulator n=1 Tax=Nocardioides sp. AE5 TaxID=2962573 RepID=UPI002880D4EE|nr:TetR/AcrR family transcriptional regulator [Nocardioides sp. AE5]MDT0201918.1 TetR/AcrR family transcriptional regulator [Nocardioides sp. AE5]
MAQRTRNAPVQSRSKETVERILDATARILEQRGYGGLTTNHVAAEAGVSVGSLYRWFADKQSLVEALRQRTNDRILAELSAAMVATAPLPSREAVGAVVNALVEQLREHAAVVGALLRESPMGTHQNVLPDVEQRLAGYVRVFVLQHAPELGDSERETRIHLAMGITLAACMRAVFDCPDGVDPERLVTMTADLLALGLTVPGPS